MQMRAMSETFENICILCGSTDMLATQSVSWLENGATECVLENIRTEQPILRRIWVKKAIELENLLCLEWDVPSIPKAATVTMPVMMVSFIGSKV